MNQVPLTFIVSQEDAFTMDGDNDVNIKCPQEALRKRQFTMHQVFNAGKRRQSPWVVRYGVKGHRKENF